MGDVLVVKFPRRPQPKRRKRPGLALSFGAGEGCVFIAASGRQKYSIKEVNALIRELRDVRDDAKARVKRG